MPIISTFFSGFNLKTYLVAGVIAIAAGYIGYLELDSKSKEIELINKEKKLKEVTDERDEAKTNNELIIQAYELTLKVEKEIAEQKAITQEQKQEVIKITSKVKEAVIKRGEIKQDEKSNFTIVTF